MWISVPLAPKRSYFVPLNGEKQQSQGSFQGISPAVLQFFVLPGRVCEEILCSSKYGQYQVKLSASHQPSRQQGFCADTWQGRCVKGEGGLEG